MKTFYIIVMAGLMTIPARILAQVPAHSSLPSAEAVLYLGFDGDVVNSTSFNYDNPIVCEPANPAADQITAIYHRIAEDYRPFRIISFGARSDYRNFLAATEAGNRGDICRLKASIILDHRCR